MSVLYYRFIDLPNFKKILKEKMKKVLVFCRKWQERNGASQMIYFHEECIIPAPNATIHVDVNESLTAKTPVFIEDNKE
jgi:hypothetical protein